MVRIVIAASLLLAVGSPAFAQRVVLKGNAAVSFIHKYFPEAPIPGPFNGTFKCNVPAMGASGNGAVSKCVLRSAQ